MSQRDQKGPQDMNAIWSKALKSGVAGSSAMVVQVCTLMWMRTTMNYQYPREVEYRENLPMTATGKIMRKDLRAR